MRLVLTVCVCVFLCDPKNLPVVTQAWLCVPLASLPSGKNTVKYGNSLVLTAVNTHVHLLYLHNVTYTECEVLNSKIDSEHGDGVWPVVVFPRVLMEKFE